MVLKINGETVEESAIQDEIERLRPHYEVTFRDQPEDEREKQLNDWSRENVIERVLLNQHARQFGDPIAAEDIQHSFNQFLEGIQKRGQNVDELTDDQRDTIRAGLENQMRVERFLNHVCKDIPQPTEDEIRAHYDQHIEEFTNPLQARVSHIVKHVNWQSDQQTALSEIQQAKDELDNGADFATVVRKYSDCPDRDGDLGYIVRGQMVEEFEDVAFNLGVGRISGVIQTRFGYHIVKVFDRKEPTARPLEEVKDQIAEKLMEARREKTIEEYLDQLKADAKIEEK